MPSSPGLSRAVLSGSLILAPLFLLAAGLLDPTTSAEDERALLAAAADSPGALAATQLFYILAGLALIPAGVGLMRLIASRAPRIALLAGGAVAAGGLSLIALETSALYLSDLATSAAPLAQQASVVAAVESSIGVLIITTIHVAGLLGGMLLAAIALFRTHAAAAWVPVAIVVGLLGMLATTEDVFVAVAGVLLTAGLGSAGTRLLGTSSKPPRGRAFTAASAGGADQQHGQRDRPSGAARRRRAAAAPDQLSATKGQTDDHCKLDGPLASSRNDGDGAAGPHRLRGLRRLGLRQ